MKPEEINALPENVRAYIHHLETDADPAGTLRENFHMKGQIEALQKIVHNEKTERRHQTYCAALTGLLSNCPSFDSMDLGSRERAAERIARESLMP